MCRMTSPDKRLFRRSYTKGRPEGGTIHSQHFLSDILMKPGDPDSFPR